MLAIRRPDENSPLSVNIDYPAAHSMDTSWYAVDADGHVALFTTGENGHAPNGTKLSRKLLVSFWLCRSAG